MMLKKTIISLFLLLLPLCLYAKKVTINGFAQPQGSYTNLPGVQVIALEKGKHMTTTDADGQFSFEYTAGEPLTLLFKAEGYVPSQSATIIVPEQPSDDVMFTYQAIAYWKFYLVRLARLLSCRSLLQNNHCQMIVTVGARGTTLYDDYQGEPNATLSIKYPDNTQAEFDKCYYGTLPLFHTNPLCLYRKTTSDGGIFVADITPEKSAYTVTAYKDDALFSTSKIICNPGWWQQYAPGEIMLINLSPPTGPTVQ